MATKLANNVYAFVCDVIHDDITCENTEFKLLGDGTVRCISCGTQYAWNVTLNDWIKIIPEEKKKPKGKRRKRKSDDTEGAEG